MHAVRLLRWAVGNQFCLENDLYLLCAGYRYRWHCAQMGGGGVQGREDAAATGSVQQI